jgi:hypothetical protein
VAQARCSDRKFYNILVIGRGKNPTHSVEYSIRRSCAIWYCATQSLYGRILPVQDRASCLPESSRRALVADAREIRQYQMHPTPEKREGRPVRRASLFFGGCHVYFRPPHPTPQSISTSILRIRIFCIPVCTGTAQPPPESLLCGSHLPLSTVDCRPPCKLPGAHAMNLQAEFFSDMLHRPCFRGVQSTVPC